MNKTKYKSWFSVGLLAGTMAISGQALAGLASDVVIDFEKDDIDGIQMNSAVSSTFSQSYIEDGVLHSSIGFGTLPGKSMGDIGGGLSHVHGESANNSRVSMLEADAGGGLFQLVDGMAFSAKNLDIAGLALDLVGGGESTVTFRGYKDAAYTDAVDFTIDKSVGSSLDFGDTFNSIYLLEYWFDAPGRGNDPGATAAFGDLKIALDNVVFGAAVTAPPANVPVPAAVWLFVSAISGLGLLRRKK